MADRIGKIKVETISFTPQSIPANNIVIFNDTSVQNKAVLGFIIAGVGSGNVSVTQLFSGTTGTGIAVKNNGSSAITPSGVYVNYLDI